MGERVRQPLQQMACKLCAMGPICAAAPPTPGHPQASEIVARAHRVEAGELLCGAGAADSSLYAIRSGFLKASVSTPAGTPQAVEFLIRGDVAGLDQIDGHAATEVVALTRCTACEIPRSRIDALCARSAAVAGNLMALMSAAIARNQMWRAALTGFSASQKVAIFLLDLARRSGSGAQMQTELPLPMRRGDVGRYLGLRDETVSRALSALQARGVLAVSARLVRILNVAALQVLVQPEQALGQNRDARLDSALRR